MRALFLALALLPAVAMASETLVAGLEQRLRKDGIEGVNTYLSAQSSAMEELGQRTADCEPRAIELTVKLSRSKNSKATEMHKEALRIAVGTCTEFVLLLLSLKEVPKICSSVSSWTVSQTARELRRRIKAIEADEDLRSTQRGRACSAAYLFELQNTRVGIRVGQPGPRAK